MPYSRNPFFTGRDQVLLDLHKALQGEGAAALSQAIRGLGGIGKTQTAVDYTDRTSELSAPPLTQQLLQQIQAEQPPNS